MRLVSLTTGLPPTSPGVAPAHPIFEAARLGVVSHALTGLKPYFRLREVPEALIENGASATGSWDDKATLILEGLLDRYFTDDYSLDLRHPRVSQILTLISRHPPFRAAVIKVMGADPRYGILRISLGAALTLR